MSSGPLLPSGGMSNYLEAALYDHLFRGIPYTAPATLYLALFTDNAGLEENDPAYYGTELSGSGYARLAVGGATARTFDDYPPDGPGVNGQVWDFAAATDDWQPVSCFAIMDADTAGNVLFWGLLFEFVTGLTGQTFRIEAGQIEIYVDDYSLGNTV